LRAALLLALSSCCLASGPAKFSCPPGTKLEKRPHTSEPVQVELCRDPRTGLREGPYRETARTGLVWSEGSYRHDKLHGEYRIYDDAGRLTHVVQYSNGQEVGTRLTRAGMENTFRTLNEKFRKNGQKMFLAVRDDHTVEYVTATTTRFSQPARDEKFMRERLVAEGSLCKMFTTYSNIQAIIARYVDDQGGDLLVVPVRRADCQ
jgi:hypothetical protein